MSKTILKGEKTRAISANVSVAAPHATVTLPTSPRCEVGTSPNPDSAAAREEEIRILAHAQWEAAGCPSGDGVDFWLEAERKADAKRSVVNSTEV